MWVPKLSLTPIKFRIFGQKRTNLAQNGHFWSNIGIFGIFGPMRDHKMMWTKCLGVFSVIWVPTILLSLVILGQAMPAYLVPWWWVGWWLWRAGCISQDTMTPKVIFLQKTMQTRCLGGFSVIWVPKILLSLVILGQAMPAYLVPWWWVGWWLWRAGCISQDTMTPIYFIYVNRGLDYYIPNTQ